MVGTISLPGSVLSTVPWETATTFLVASMTTSGSGVSGPDRTASGDERADVLGVGEWPVARELQPRRAVEEDPARPRASARAGSRRADRGDAVPGEDLVVVGRAGLHAAGEQLAHDRVVQPAHGCAGGRSPKNGGGPFASGITIVSPTAKTGTSQRLGDELLGVEGAVADQRVERPLVADRDDVLEVVLDLADEELVEVERDQLGPLSAARSGNRSLRLPAITSVARW